MIKNIIRFNKEQAGIELVIADKRRLSGEELRVIREVLHLKWNHKGGFWYNDYSKELMDALRASCFCTDGENEVPKKTLESEMAKLAKAKAEATAKKQAEKPKKAPKRADQMEALSLRIDQLTALVTAMAKAQIDAE